LRAQIHKVPVSVELGKQATPQRLARAEPDVLILATGGSPIIPQVPGIERLKPMTYVEVLSGAAQVGDRIVVIGGGMVGCEVAELLAQQGKRVTILEILDEVAQDMWFALGTFMRARLEDRKVTILTGVKYEECTDQALNIVTKDKIRLSIEADTVVVAAGAKPDSELLTRLEVEIPEVHLVGDCAQPGTIPDAMASAHRVGLMV